MSKNKDVVEELRQKLFERKKEEQVEEANKELSKDLTMTTYVVFQDPNRNGHNFLVGKILFNPETRKALIDEVIPFEDRAAGLTFVMNQENMKVLFGKNKRRQK